MSLHEIFHAVLRASCLGSAAVLLLLAIRRTAGKTVSPVWRCWLWLPVAALFVMPRLPDLGFGWKEAAPVMAHEWLGAQMLPLDTAPQAMSEAASAPVSAPIIEAPVVIPWREWLRWTWFGGAVALLGLWLASYGCLLNRVRHERKLAPDSLRLLLANCAQEAGLRKVPRLVVTDALENPAVAGLLWPVVLVPDKLSNLLAPDELRLVLLHEVWHLKRRDLWWHWFAALLLAVHWFNPLLWIAMRLFRADREAACDAAVLSNCPGDSRGFYGKTLLKLQAQFVRVFALRPMIGVLGGADLLKARIVDIANFGRGSRFAGCAALFFVAVVTATMAVLAGEPMKVDVVSKEKVEVNSSAGSPGSTDLEEVLRRIDHLAGVIPATVYVTTRIIAFDGSKELGPPLSWVGINSSHEPGMPKPMLEQIATFDEPQVSTLMRTVDPEWHDLNETPAAPSPPGNVRRALTDAFKKVLALGHPRVASAPSVTMRSGQKGQVEVVREFIYATAFERQDVAEPAGNPKIVPTSFNMQPLGIRVELSPKVYPQGLIGLNLTPTLSAFLKWQEFKSEDGQFLRNPIFGSTTCNVALNLSQGQTAVFGGYAYKAVFEKRTPAEAADHPPGDALCPVLMLVNAKLVGPLGKPSKHGVAESGGIVIPSLQVSDVTLADAVSQICDLAKKNDPRGEGINIMLSSPAASDSRVTLNVSDVKLSTLLDLFAKLAHLDLQVEGEAVMLSSQHNEKSELPKAHATIGQKSFLKGDHIEILDVKGTSSKFEVGDRVIVKGWCQLKSHEAASICLFTTQTDGDGGEETDRSQKMKVEKGTHDFELSCTIRKKGCLHVSFYDLEHGEGFGGVYFGSARQMDEFNVGDWPAQPREKKGPALPHAPDEPAARFVPNNAPVTPTKP